MTQGAKVAWITGGGTGIGLGGAQALAAEGWTVIISGRRKDGLDAAAKRIGGKVEAIPLDVADPAQAEKVAAEILRTHGHIDLLVNSAGLNIRDRSWTDLTAQGWDSVVSVNLNGVIYCMRSVLPAASGWPPRPKTIGSGFWLWVASSKTMRLRSFSACTSCTCGPGGTTLVGWGSIPPAASTTWPKRPS